MNLLRALCRHLNEMVLVYMLIHILIHSYVQVLIYIYIYIYICICAHICTGIIKKNEISSFYVSDNSAGKFSVKFDYDTRIKAFSILSSGINKLINKEIVSVFEEANSFAKSVMENSPITSPVNSPMRERRTRAFSFASNNNSNNGNSNHRFPIECSDSFDDDGSSMSMITGNEYGGDGGRGRSGGHDGSSSSTSSAIEVLSFDDLLGIGIEI